MNNNGDIVCGICLTLMEVRVIFRFVLQGRLSEFQLFFSALAQVSCHIFKHLSNSNRPGLNG